MNNTVIQTENGKIFKCAGCDKIHIEYKNLNFNFDEEEYNNFSKYFAELDGQYWENLNSHVLFRKKIIVPVGHKSLNVLLNNDELQELKILFSKSTISKLKILSHLSDN